MKKLVCLMVLAGFLSACATDPYTGESKVAKTAWGTGIGAAAGAGIGALIGGKKGALIGAGIGAATGAAGGGYMDYQAAQLRKELTGTGVQVKEIDGRIYLVMPGNITFDTNQAFIKQSFQPVVISISKVLKEYDKTLVQVNGYTDNTGSDAINNPLSVKRANAIADFLKIQGVAANRIIANGYGSANPIASNATAAGREQNRRVEIVLINNQ
ncbi:MAG: OmpA family protein [Alphaproteobacteria bacterium]|nr:OmpA family protein [Alphaproteobacteria bacterium]